MQKRSKLTPATRARCAIAAALLFAACARGTDTRSRADSAALAASGGVRTDSGAVPMRVSRSRSGPADDAAPPFLRDEWNARQHGDSRRDDPIDATIEDIENQVEQQLDESVAAAHAQADAERARAMDELHATLERRRDEMRDEMHERRMMHRMRMRERSRF